MNRTVWIAAICCLTALSATLGAEEELPRDRVQALIKRYRGSAREYAGAANSLRVQARRLTPAEQRKIGLWLALAQLNDKSAGLLAACLKEAGKRERVTISRRALEQLELLGQQRKKLVEALKKGTDPLRARRPEIRRPRKKKADPEIQRLRRRMALLKLEARMHEIEAFRHKMEAKLRHVQMELIENEIHRREVAAAHRALVERIKREEGRSRSKRDRPREKKK